MVPNPLFCPVAPGICAAGSPLQAQKAKTSPVAGGVRIVSGLCRGVDAARIGSSMGALQVDSIIDIFNKRGEYLYSFTNNSIGSAVIIKKGKIYIGPNALGEDKLKAFDIIYSTDQNKQ